MTNRPEHYGISSPGGLAPMEGHLGYDTYVETAKIRATAEKSLVFQQMQTALLGNMAGTLRDISNEMTQIRGLHEEALAVQQELLKRDVVQQHLEELLFQADKLVVECSDPKTDMPPSSRFFLLQGFLKTVEQQGIGTPIIRGRDNKTEFERVVKEGNGLVQRLYKDPEVQQAIAWAKKLEEQRQRKRAQIEQKAAPLRAQLESLQEQRRTPVSLRQVASNWIERLKSFVPAQHRKLALVLVPVLGTCLFPVTIFLVLWLVPFLIFRLWLDRSRKTQERNAKLDKEIAQIEDKIRGLLAER